ncbi:MAG: lactate racemase domain-containing protein [Deltaproteobacteria bacterium]|nr:lactate racemase domain-containing protein [Deltaproteobacteria bacterium]
MSPSVLSVAEPQGDVAAPAVSDLVVRAFPAAAYKGRRVVVVVPDATRSGPIDRVWKALHAAIAADTAAFDVLVALGTHQPMSEAAICQRLGLSPEERATTYARVKFMNHAWDDPSELVQVGTLTADEVHALTNGMFAMDVPVEVNKHIFDYDETVIIGPVFPHEVVGFSGGNKYLFPGVAGARILNFFHWLGAVVTNPMIIGVANTPVRQVVDRAGAMVKTSKRCLALVVEGSRLAGLFVGTPEDAWKEAAQLSAQLHITYKDKPFHKVLSCVPAMYDDLWTGGKGMYKLEPVLADGAELIIYGPHIHEVSVTHNETMLKIGYHCRDYFLKQWDAFKHYPWGVLAHSTHVRGGGTFENGVERCRVKVTLATSIPPQVCAQINMGYLDPATVNPADYAGQEEQGVLLVPKAGETLFKLKTPPPWAA